MGLKYFYNFSARNFPDYSITNFNSMIVMDGYIINCGNDIKLPTTDIEKIDLNGAFIFPPFVDSHTHFLQTGIVLSGIQLDNAESLDDIFYIISKECQKNKIVIAWNFDITNLKEKRYPTIDELNKISQNNFIWIVSKDLHLAIVNNKALSWAKKNYNGIINEDGIISGEAYNSLCYKINNLLTDSYKKQCLIAAENQCINKGVATVHALEGTENDFSETQLVSDFFENSKIDGFVFNQSSNPSFPVKMGWKQIGGCILVDGSIGSRTAALFDNYNDSKTKGSLLLNSEFILDITRKAYENNLQLALHAIGDLACEIVSSSYVWGSETYSNSQISNRIEHFILPNNKAIRNVRKSKTIISIQPAFDYFWGTPGGIYEQRLGTSRAKSCNPFKTLSDSGISLIGGSDSPVTPIDPILGIHSIVNHNNKDERLSLNQAFNIFINEPHRSVGNFETNGKLEKGNKADFICLDQDPFKVFKHKIKDIKVTSMYLKGIQIKKAPI